MKNACRWLLVMLSLTFMACHSTTAPTCAIDADCPNGWVCIDHRCRDLSDGGGDGQDGGGDADAGIQPDLGDLGGVDGGVLLPCQDSNQCRQGEVCFNNFCISVEAFPNCPTGDEDLCLNDRYCEPSLKGCVPWPARPEPQPRCQYFPPEGEFTPVEEWVWEKPAAAPEWDEVMMTPVVIRLTPQEGDVFVPPAVLFNSFRADRGYSQDGILRAVRGVDGKEIFSVTDERYYTHPVSQIAAGDLDGDGYPEIVTGKNGGKDLICFEHDGSFKWATEGGTLTVGWGGPAIANIDGEGPPEIVIGAAVVNADGSIRWVKSGSRGEQPGTGTAAPFSLPVDVDGDGKMEILTGDTCYDHQGNIKWQTGYGDGFVAVANFIGSAQRPEMVVVSRGSIRLQSVLNGEIIWLRTAQELNELPQCQPDCGLLGPPTVADFDGDGKPEIGVAGADVYMVIRGDTGQVLWSIQSRDASSNITGSAVFDFEGDRRAEVVYADEIYLRVLRGRDGKVLYQQPHSSLTACEYPVIADVDGDHNAEIVIAQNTLMADAPHKFKGVRVFGDAQDNWVDTRPLWNQHAYHVTNINDDGTIPLDARRNWQVEGLNNFRQNMQGEGLFNAPDLTVRLLEAWTGRCYTTGLVLWAEVYNRGELEVPPGVPVSFYQGDPRQGGTRLGTVYTQRLLRPGASEQLYFVWVNPPRNTPLTVFVVVDDKGWDAANNRPDGIHSECREGNNLGSLSDIICRPET
jgi:hypothetical protein